MVVAFRYITKELVAVFAVVFMVLLLIALGGRFIGYLQEAALGRYSADVLMTLLGLRLPEFVQITAPFAFFLAILMTYGRLHADREFTVLMSGGANPMRMLTWLGAIAIPVGALVGYLSLSVTPLAKRAFNELALEQRVTSEFEAITPGVFHTFEYGRRVTYTEKVDADRRRLSDVFMGERRGETDVIVWAEAGSQFLDPVTGSRFLLLDNGTRYEGKPGSGDYRVITFKRLGQRIERRKIVRSRIDAETLPTGELDLVNAEQAAEMQWRIGLPVLTVIGAFCGFGLARVRPRAGRFAKIVPGILIFVAYYLLCIVTQSAIANGFVPAELGLWPVHAAMIIVAVYLIRGSYRPV